MSYQIQEYSETAAALSMLREKYATIFDVSTTKGMDTARKARAEVRGYRVALEKLRTDLKVPALERSRLIDAEAKRITAELLAIEEPIDAVIKAEEQRKEEAKAAKAKVEAERIARITTKISLIRGYISLAPQSSQVIRDALNALKSADIAVSEYEEFTEKARIALRETIEMLGKALEARIAQEAEATRLKAEREELAQLRAQEEARLAEKRREDEARNKAEADRLKAEREAQEAELRQRQEAQEKAEADARRKNEAEAARIAEERQRLEGERIKREAEARARKEAEQRAGDPVYDLKIAIAADASTAAALDEAYARGYQAGFATHGKSADFRPIPGGGQT